jgi:hypothetical protein
MGKLFMDEPITPYDSRSKNYPPERVLGLQLYDVPYLSVAVKSSRKPFCDLLCSMSNMFIGTSPDPYYFDMLGIIITLTSNRHLRMIEYKSNTFHLKSP